MQEMTKKAVQKLLQDTSHVLVVEDFSDIRELDKLACAIVKKTADDHRLLNQPFELCGIKFYPLTIAKSLWYAEKVQEWELEGIFQECFLFWLLTLPLTDEALNLYSCRKDAENSSKKLAKKLHCSQSELTDVFKNCVGSPDSKSSKEAADYGALVAVLLREYGGTPDQWLYETPVEKIGSLVGNYIARINAEHEASANSSSRSGKAVAPKATAKLEALKNFREKCNAIKQKWVANG